MSNLKEKIPNWLTYLRVALIPFFILFYYLETGTLRYITCSIFIIAAITDFFDGYLSRLWNVQSKFGAMLDQISDKLLICTALCLILTDEPLLAIPVIVIICREIFISGMREYLGNQHVEMPVSKLAKWKTASQMVAMILLCLTAGAAEDVLKANLVFYTGAVILMISCVLAVYTGYQYTKAAKDQNLF